MDRDESTPDPARPAADPAHDVLRAETQSLDPIFEPRHVAVVGATEAPGSIGRSVLSNLLGSPFGGTVFPVTAEHTTVLGVRAYPSIAAVPAPVDLAVVVTPAETVPGIVHDCVEAGVHGALVVSAGFEAMGQRGVELAARMLEAAHRGRLRIVGPNCLGIMNPHHGLNATFASGMALPGSVAFVSQSGALCTAILDWSRREQVGFSAFVSIGSMLDVGWGDLIDHLGSDPHTRSILLYMESIGDARAFLSAAREVALTKPIIVIKPGRTEAAARAAASHSGALAGDDEVLDAAFRRAGVLRVQTIAELFHMAEVLAKQPRPRGNRLAILTNAGGPGVLATDALIAHGGALAPLEAATRAGLEALLPPQWSHGNPIDILDDADPQRYAAALELAARDATCDGLLVVLTPQALTDATRTAEALQPYARSTGKPLLASWMGGDAVAAGVSILSRAGIPVFPYPDEAARMFDSMWRYSDNLRGLYETPSQVDDTGPGAPDRARAAAVIEAARQAGRTLLGEHEAKQILAAYGIPVVETRLARGPDEAVGAAAALGYPVVLKLHSESIAHKSEVGGVQLDLPDAAAVHRAWDAIETAVGARAGREAVQGMTVQRMVRRGGWELMLGSAVDPQCGPVLLFGVGGRLVEVLRDRALGLPPLDTTLARRMMERTRIWAALQGAGGHPPVDVAGLEQLLVRFAQLVAEQRWIRDFDVNPLLASYASGGEQAAIVALDARVILHGPGVGAADLPRLAIRPYPIQYVGPSTLRDGTPVMLRPIRPEDEPLMVQFHRSLSERSVYLRYFQILQLRQRVAHERLTRICFNDYDREMALVAVHEVAGGAGPEIVGVGRLSRLPGRREGEFAITVSDLFQGRGLGTALLHRLVEIGRAEGLARIRAEMLPDNLEMQRICARLGFRLRPSANGSTILAGLDLGAG